jgi:hypothetical protein
VEGFIPSSANSTELSGRQLTVYTDGTAPNGTYLTITVEYYAQDGLSQTLPPQLSLVL